MLLEFKDISYKYPGSINEVFKNLSCRISTPGFHSLFGPSGVGKTTLAKMMIGEVKGFGGKILTSEIHRILYTYNLERLPGWSSVREHLQATTPESGKDKIDELVTAFGLEACMQSRFARLSLGQQNRTNLARYLLQNFDLLIMDESLANVDERTRENIILRIKDMFPDAYFLYISHNVIEVSKFCRDILVFRNSQKSPQVVTVKGRDHKLGETVAKDQLEQTMLEIMHAS